MYRFRLVRNLRTAVWLFFFALIPLSLIGLYWANQTGLPSKWRTAIEQEISKHGIHTEIGSISYIPFRGFVASNVRIYAEEERINEISKLERVQLVLDYANLSSGHFRLRKLELRNAELSIAVDPNDPTGEALKFTKIYGTILMPDEESIEIRNIRGKVEGIDVTLNASLETNNPSVRKKPDNDDDGQRRVLMDLILKELSQWNFDADNAPKIQIDLEGNVFNRESINGQIHFQANYIEKNDFRLDQVTGKGNLASNLLTITEFAAKDSRGEITGSADYLITKKEGRFNLESSIAITRLLDAWFAIPFQIDLLSGGSQKISFNGGFDLSDSSKPDINLTGYAKCESIMFRGVSFDTLETWFSWQNRNLYLRDIRLTRPDGQAVGKFLKERNLIRIKLDSSFPSSLYKPFFKDKPLEKVLNDFGEKPGSNCHVSLEGSMDTENKLAWSFVGNAKLKDMSYRQVPFHQMVSSFSLNAHEFEFYNGSLDFDYSDYTLRKTYGGPDSGKATIGRIHYDRKEKLIDIKDVSGIIWAAPMARMFAPKIADNLEKYRFHRPHTISGSGQVDITTQGRTNLIVKFSTKNSADYRFLGKDLTLTNPSATVTIRNKDVEVTDLTSAVVGGSIKGKIKNQEGNKLSGELSWTELGVSELSSVYGIKVNGGGDLTGRIEFSMKNGDVSTMNGTGLVAMKDGELFSVPMFGPLSTLVSKVVNNKRVGHERAKSAFCNFTIKDGIANTRDFQTHTSSVNFTGDGSIDLSKKTIDFTIRLNARGILGLIFTPLKPFYGLFQFKGTGPLNKMEWENVHFTSPPDEQNEILLSPPRAKTIKE